MNKSLYARLAAQNMRRNARFYLPYLLAIIGTAAGFYIVAALALDPGLISARRSIDALRSMMLFGLLVLGLFTFIFLLYTNSFLIKRRRKELGLYRILGMEKRHLAAIMAWEALYTAGAGIAGGLAAGLLLYKLTQLLLCRIMRYDVVFGLSASPLAMLVTAVFFAGIILFLLLMNLLSVRKVRPIELMQGAGAGEREPRTRWLLTLLGLLTLGGGYWIALTTRDALQALMLYFVAVVLVIIGTYCLFTSVSIAALKLMRRSKGFYYRPNHFISVSGMLYRMKQNAVGLANVCILSTMVMVMVSGTVSLYAGTEDAIRRSYPADLSVTLRYDPSKGDRPDFAAIEAALTETLAANAIPVKRFSAGESLSFSASAREGGFALDNHNEARVGSHMVYLDFITAQEYARLTGGHPPELDEDEVIVADGSVPGDGAFGLFLPEGSDLRAMRLRVAERTGERLALESTQSGLDAGSIVETVTLVVRDRAALLRVFDAQRAAYSEVYSRLKWEAHIDTDAPDDVVLEGYAQLYDAVDIGDDALYAMGIGCRAAGEQDAYSLNGSFLFLGLFLALVLIIATVLIIYYKQISEGYDDQARFVIMQKVGLSRREARRTISHQILMVFFMPLVVAGLHILLDFRMLNQLLGLFSITNTHLAALCSLATFGAFSAVYGAVYLLTARAYYRIVQ